jgi:hypothetical protein
MLFQNLCGLGSGSGPCQFEKPDPDKNRPDPQHWLLSQEMDSGQISEGKNPRIMKIQLSDMGGFVMQGSTLQATAGKQATLLPVLSTVRLRSVQV